MSLVPGSLPPAGTSRDRAAGVRFRRALALMVMTLVVPGSAQLAAGNRRLGWLAVRVWLGLLALTVFLLGLGSLWGGLVFWFLSNGAVLFLLRLGLIALAVGWAALFVDAWRLGQPLRLAQRQRLAMVGVNGLLCFSTAGTLLFGAHVVGVQRDLLASMFGDGTAYAATDGRFNVLLLGGDSGKDRWGLRPDSITVASVDAETGKTVLFGLPRNLRNFTFPEGSVMAEQFPGGYDCDDCYLNSLATWARDREELFTAYDDPGVEATMEAVEGITGLDLHYYAMVNLAGFRTMVDAVGGVRLTVRDRIPIGGIGAPITGYIEPGTRKLNGFETLWFARSRVAADDYSRMARQKCVMGAMLAQLDPATVMTRFEEIAAAGEAMVETDLPASEVGTFVELALKARSKPIRTVSFVPPLINTGDPDLDLIRDRVAQAIDRSEGEADGSTSRTTDGEPATRGSAAPRQTPQGAEMTGGSLGNLRDGYAANDADDLQSVC